MITAPSDKDSTICVDHVCKFFEVYEKPQHRLCQMLWRGKRCFYTQYWALRDISFTVRQGECVGIIGRNGTGKSTLLQIITGTLAPSAGSVDVRGRVAALLELGSGFNPEFTGRENVYLNASILGLTKEEIDQRYADIVAFADIGDFIDQPVKSYSSGMVVRLAFAVVAHVDADILIIDEALAVGDAFFQQKCIRFISRFIAEHTVLFVSHDTTTVNKLCNRAILLENGTLKQNGNPEDVTKTYLEDLYSNKNGVNISQQNTNKELIASLPHLYNEDDHRDIRSNEINNSKLRNDIQISSFNSESDSFGKGGMIITNACFMDNNGHWLRWLVGGEPIKLYVGIHAYKDIMSPILGFLLKNSQGQNLFGDNTFLTYREHPLFLRPGQDALARFSFVMPVLPVGRYTIALGLAEGTQEAHVQHHWMHAALSLTSVATSCQDGVVKVPMRHICMEIL